MTLRNKADHRLASELPTWRVVAPLRCAHPIDESRSQVCSARASWQRRTTHAPHALFYCERHQQPGDTKIGPAFDFRRVSVRLDVVFTGTSALPTFAHQEAYERLARAVEAVGGLVNLHEIRSDVGRYAPEAAPARPGAKVGGRGAR